MPLHARHTKRRSHSSTSNTLLHTISSRLVPSLHPTLEAWLGSRAGLRCVTTVAVAVAVAEAGQRDSRGPRLTALPFYSLCDTIGVVLRLWSLFCVIQ